MIVNKFVILLLFLFVNTGFAQSQYSITGIPYTPTGYRYTPSVYYNRYNYNNYAQRNYYQQYRLRRIQTGLQIGRFKRQAYKEYMDWKVQKQKIDNETVFASINEKEKYEKEMEAIKNSREKKITSPNAEIIFKGKSYKNFDELKETPEWKSHINKLHRRNDREVREEKQEYNDAVEFLANQRNY